MGIPQLLHSSSVVHPNETNQTFVCEQGGDLCVNRTRLRSGDGALVHRNPLAYVVEGLQCDHIVGAGVWERERQ